MSEVTPDTTDQILTSWKEIAEHLDVSVRTAQKWDADFGLPVFRVPNPRGRVHARVSDLENWRLVHRGEAFIVSGTQYRILQAVSRPSVYISLALAVVFAAGLILYSRRPGLPVVCDLHGSVLVASDAAGREKWRYTFDRPSRLSQPAWIGELGSAGEVEIVVGRWPDTHEDLSGGAVFCFSESGKLKWSFSGTRGVRTHKESFDPPMGFRQFRVVNLGADRGKAVVALLNHSGYYPAQVVLLDPNGKVSREYWHSGQLNAIAALDIAGLGRDLVYLGGIANASKQAVLVVLDPLDFAGASREENPDYQFIGMPPPREWARILFPKNRLTAGVCAYGEVTMIVPRAHELSLHVNDVGCVQTRTPGRIYDLYQDLKLKDAELGDGFYQDVHQLTGSTERLTPAELAGLRNIRYLTPPPSQR